MGRWAPGARERLERAAIELFVEQGFADTTVPQITARAGLTTRTFFRHFADKREVLFAGTEIPDLAARIIAELPASMAPMEVIVEGLRAVAAERFDGRRAEMRQHFEIIRSDEGLRERDLRKNADLVTVLTTGFVARGLEATSAALAAHVTVVALDVALERWVREEPERPVIDVVLDALGDLHALTATFDPTRATPNRAVR